MYQKDLALNNQWELICYKTQPTNQSSEKCYRLKICNLYHIILNRFVVLDSEDIGIS